MDSDAPVTDMTVETPRLVLRRMRPDDAADVLAYASDAEVTRYVTWPAHASIEDSQAFLRHIQGVYERTTHAAVPFAMVERASGRMIGTCGPLGLNEQDQRAVLGYAMGRAYWGRGLMSEAVKAVIGHLFAHTSVNRIESCCHIANTGSYRVMEKAGMHFEGILRQYRIIKGLPWDLRIYSILRSEWADANV